MPHAQAVRKPYRSATNAKAQLSALRGQNRKRERERERKKKKKKKKRKKKTRAPDIRA